MVFRKDLPVGAPDDFQNILIQSDRILKIPLPVDKLLKLGHHPIRHLQLCLSFRPEQKTFERRIPFRKEKPKSLWNFPSSAWLDCAWVPSCPRKSPTIPGMRTASKKRA